MSGKTILLVEDNPDDIELTQMALQAERITVNINRLAFQEEFAKALPDWKTL